MPKLLNIIFRCVWAFGVISAAVGFGAAWGWHKHGLVAAIALGFVGLVVSWPAAYSPALFFQFLAEMLAELVS
ncbi:hypothetical protein [Rhizobium sp. No.120]